MSSRYFYAFLLIALLAVFGFTGFVFTRNFTYNEGSLRCEHFFQSLSKMADNRDFAGFNQLVSHHFIQSLEKELIDARTVLNPELQEPLDRFYCTNYDYERFILLVKLMEKFGEPVQSDFSLTNNNLEVISSYRFPNASSLVPVKFVFLRKNNSIQLQSIEGLKEALHSYHASPLSEL